jgi:hypothetical protein
LWRSLRALDAYRKNFEATPETFTNAVLLGSLLVPLGSAPRPDRRQQTPRLGELPLARRDLERLRQLLSLQRRLHDASVSPRAERALTHRSVFRDALSWLEIHGGAPDLVEHWISVLAARGAQEPVVAEEGEARPARRRRRRRRRRRYPAAPEQS